MAIGVHRVQVIKQESAALGGDSADDNGFGGPLPIEPQEDALEAAGVYFQDSLARDLLVYLARDTGRLVGRDTVDTTPFPILRHASRHEENGLDELFAENLGSGTLVPDRVMVTDGLGGWVISDFALVQALVPELNTVESAALSTTASTTYQNKATLTTTALLGGTYFILYQAVMSGSQNGTVFKSRSVLDGDTVTPLNEIVMKSSANGTQLPYFGHKVSVLAAGVHEVKLDWAVDSGGGNAEVRQARISLWRIA